MLNGGMRCMSAMNNGNILVGTENGLFEINTHTDEVRKLITKQIHTQSIQSYKCIYIDKMSRIWLGTDGAGIEVFDKNYQLLNSFNTTQAH